MRTFAIGDIHGHYDQLIQILAKIEQEANFSLENDHLVLLGDLVDVGPDTKKVLDFCIDHKARHPETFHPIRGNHDDMMIKALKDPTSQDAAWWLENYASPTLASYGGSVADVPQAHIDFLDALPYCYWPEDSEYFFVHGGLPPRLNLSELDPDDPETQQQMLWIRSEFYNSDFDWIRKIIFGHTPFDDHTNMNPDVVRYVPLVKDNLIGINTLPRNQGRLTCIQLPDEVFFSGEEV